MHENSFTHIWAKRTKFLTQALIISGTLNIGLISTFIYFVLSEKEGQMTQFKPQECAAEPLPDMTNTRLLRAYSLLPFQDLILRLEDKDLVEEGYMKRDLALACLVAFHHFNLEKALGGLHFQQRQISFVHEVAKESVDLTVFPGLADYQYQAICHYARTERWPFTSQGLFFELKSGSSQKDPTLLEAFYLTPEFHAISTLFTRSGLPLEKEAIIALIVEGEWKIVQEFTLQQKQMLDLSINSRRCFILSYLNYRSKQAASLLLTSDFDFVAKRLDDAGVLLILDILTDKTEVLENFAKELITSARSDLVWKKAACKLYGLYNETVPEPYTHQTTLARFMPSLFKSEPVVSAPLLKPTSKSATPLVSKTSSKKRLHTVAKGDSLWKIAHKYGVTIEAITKHNHLESEKLRVGKQLEIP